MRDFRPNPHAVDPVEYSTGTWIRCFVIAGLGLALYWICRAAAELIAVPGWGTAFGLPYARVLGHLLSFGPAFAVGRLLSVDRGSAALPPVVPTLAAGVTILIAGKMHQDPLGAASLLDNVLRGAQFYFIYAGLKGRFPRP
ncbi:hypothetical protein J8J14_00050 [Roseomonas sp. SSH11]|uniref:Uncharacterized protein n=1 Tax=Pararoseomonas baculiformis TaxID=2820812 RepID=A0ABS4A993_9PROT|nr:hypothetical protein [Pararoseomonas baculiformis]MBP0443155.1 hypothetical protein [Pararoseomonas baculiformis]